MTEYVQLLNRQTVPSMSELSFMRKVFAKLETMKKLLQVCILAITSLCCASFVCAQQAVAYYCTGDVINTTPYVSVFIDKAPVKSVGINEYHVVGSEGMSTCSVNFKRKGLGTITKNISNPQTIFQIVLRDASWEVQEISAGEAPRLVLESLEKKISALSETQTSSRQGSVLVNFGVPPPSSSVLLLFDVEDNSQCQAIAQIAKGILASQFQVLDREDLEKLLSEQQLSMSGLVSEDDKIEAGNVVGAQFAVRLNCTNLDGNFLVTLEFINSETSSIEGVLTLSSSTISGAAELLLGEISPKP